MTTTLATIGNFDWLNKLTISEWTAAAGGNGTYRTFDLEWFEKQSGVFGIPLSEWGKYFDEWGKTQDRGYYNLPHPPVEGRPCIWILCGQVDATPPIQEPGKAQQDSEDLPLPADVLARLTD